jgi:hypothetical protein
MEKKVKNALLKDLRKLIQDQKDEVIPAVQAAIEKHISKKSPKECLTLVTRSKSGAVRETIPMGANKRYASALIAFVRKADFEGKALDSALTDSTSAVVADAFSDKIGAKADALAEKVVPILISDARFVDALSAAVVSAYSGPFPQHLRSRIVGILTAKIGGALSQSIDTATSATIKASVIKVTAVSVSSPIAVKITAAIVKSLSVVLKPLILKLMASSAFKAAIMTKLKAIVIGSMLGAFVKIIAVKLGISTGAAFMWILLPLVFAWLAYEVSSFPEKLASKVSAGVAAELDENFKETSASLAEMLVERVIVDSVGLIANDLVNDGVIASLIADSIAEAA